MKNNRASYIGLYGNVAIEKGYCKQCHGFAFIMDDRLRCCNRKYIADPERYKRETEAEGKRRRPPKKERDAQFKEQDGRCYWCDVHIFRRITRNGNVIRLKLHWDHMVPYCYSQDNRKINFVASCHVCNRIKGSMIFKTVEECRSYVHLKRIEKGYL